MRIIPVMDLMGEKVVHAVGGQREKYKPLESPLTGSSDPISVAAAFRKLGLEELYVADLDAIRMTGQNLDLVKQIVARGGMDIMLDAGFHRFEEVNVCIGEGIRKIVLATETLESFKEVSKVIAEFGMQVVASIDVKFGQVIAKSKAMRLPLGELVEEFEANGASEILLLSLDRVGTAHGPDYSSLKEVLSRATLPVLVGGGVKDAEDIRRLGEQGVSGVLVATMLHTGTITKKELDQLRQSL